MPQLITRVAFALQVCNSGLVRTLCGRYEETAFAFRASALSGTASCPDGQRVAVPKKTPFGFLTFCAAFRFAEQSAQGFRGALPATCRRRC